MIKTKNCQTLKYWHVNNLYGWAVSQNLPVKTFKWVEDISEFDESFIKSYNEASDEISFLEVNVQCPENLHNLHNDLWISF